MKRPRITIGVVMVGVLILAADFALFRKVFADPYGSDTIKVVVSAPTMSLLLFAIIIVWSELRRRREATPFAVGFCLVGAFTVVVFAWVWSDDRSVGRCIEWLLRPLERRFPQWSAYESGEAEMSIATVVFAIPQLLLATIGGVISSRIGLRLTIVTRSARVSDLPETVVDVVK